MKRLFSLLCLAMALLITGSNLALAQPPDEEGSTMDVEASEIGKEWEALRSRTELLEIRDPKTAVARYQDYYHRRAFRSPSVSILVCSYIAQLYRTELGDRDKAIQTLQMAWDKYSWHRNGSRLQQELNALKNNQPRIPRTIRLRAP